MLTWLTVISHGQNDSGGAGWQEVIANAIATNVEKARPQSQNRVVHQIDPTETSSGLFNDAGEVKSAAEKAIEVFDEAVASQKFLVVDWGKFVDGSRFKSPNVADEVGARLGLIVGHVLAKIPEIQKVHFIGFSRGAYVTNTAAGILAYQDDDALVEAGDEVDASSAENTRRVVNEWRGNPRTYAFTSPAVVHLTTLDGQDNLPSEVFENGIGSRDGELNRYPNINYWENYYQRESDWNGVQGDYISDADVNVDITDTSLIQSVAGTADYRAHSLVHTWYRLAIEKHLTIDQPALWNDAIVNRQRWELNSDVRVLLPALGEAGTVPSKTAPRIAGATDATITGQTSGGTSVGSPDDHGDNAANARRVILPSSGSQSTVGAIGTANESDWFRVTTIQNGLLKIEAGTPGSNLDSHLTIYDSGENRIMADNDRGPGTDAKVCLPVTANETYLVEVAGVGTSTGSYTLLTSQPDSCSVDPLVQLPPTSPPHQDDFPNSIEDATGVALDADGNATIDGNTHVANDEDWVRFTTRQDGNLVIEIDAPRSSLDTHLRLHNDSVLLAQDHSRIERPVAGGETFYLNIRPGSENGIDDIAPGEDATGRWRLRISQPSTLPGNSGTDGPPGPLPGWGGVRGVQIRLDENQEGNSRGFHHDPADVTWLQVNGRDGENGSTGNPLVMAGNMTVTITPDNDDFKPFVTVFRSNGGGLDTDSGEFDGQARVGFLVAEGETIIISVSGANGRSTGGFSVQVEQPDNLPDDDVHDFGEQPRDLDPQITDEGDGSFVARIETSDDNDWYVLPIAGQGYFTFEVIADNSTVIPLVELSYGNDDNFFASVDGRDGTAKLTFLPEAGRNKLYAKISSLDDTQGRYQINVWRGQNPDDDFPDGGGVFLQRRPLAEHGQIFINGTLEHPGDRDDFHIRVEQPGPVAVQYIPPTVGLDPFFHRSRDHDDPNEFTNTSGRESGRGGRAFEIVPDILAAPRNQLVLNMRMGEHSTVSAADYVVHVWQPHSAADIDADTIGIEASPVLLDGTGNGSLPGEPNGSLVSPSLNHSGDVDTFQARAVSDRPITFTVSGQDTFITIYDASGRSIATDRGSGPDGASEVIVEANRGDLFYIAVKAFNETDTGDYTVAVSQPIDDHPDAAIFTPLPSRTNAATFIPLNGAGFGEATGMIEETLVGDHDVFYVTSPRRGVFTIDVATTDDRLDTLVRIYDSRGNLVAIDDDGGDGRNSSVAFPASMDEIYFIDVGGYGDNSVGTYRVAVQNDEPPRQAFIGQFDTFSDSRLDDVKWHAIELGPRAAVRQESGVVNLVNDVGADSTSAGIRSRANVVDDVQFDFTPQLGGSFGTIEVTDRGTNVIWLQLFPGENDMIDLSVFGVGYREISRERGLSLTDGTTYHARIKESNGVITVTLDDRTIAEFEGTFRPRSILQAHLAASGLITYDDFNDNTIDPDRWNVRDSVREEGGRIHLDMYRNGSLQDSEATTRDKAGGHDITGFKVNVDRTAGTVGPGQAESEIALTNGTDWIIIKWLNDVNQFVLRAHGHYGNGDVHRWDPDEPGNSETPDGPLEVRQHDDDIEVLHNNEVVYTFAGMQVQPGSYFRANAYGQVGENGQALGRDYEITLDDLRLYTAAESRSARLTLDNVQGSFLLPDDAELVEYDDFDDNQIDFDKFHISGMVEERDGALKSSLFRSGQAVQGYATTAGTPGGVNIRGFKLGFSRTADVKNLAEEDLYTRLELTNGTDWIRIGRLEKTTYRIETGGAYGTDSVDVSVPAGQIPDGTFEVRERDGNIEVLHDSAVKFTLTNQTVRAGSYFVFYTHGNPANKSLRDVPDSFGAEIDNLRLYVDPVPYDLQVTPSLAQGSDTGASNTDHVINQLAFDLEWPAGPDGTKYQWNVGELLDDGTIEPGVWSEPQGETTAHAELDGASVHVLTVRPISPDGIVGEGSSRGFVVDVEAPTVTSFTPTVVATDPLELSSVTFSFSEPLDAGSVSLDDVVSFVGPGNVDLADQLESLTADAETVAVAFASQTVPGTYELTLSPAIRDVAGNLLDQDGDGTAGEVAEDQFTALTRINTPPVAPDLVRELAEDTQLVLDIALLASDVDGFPADGTTVITSEPMHGRADIDLGLSFATGKIFYTPNENYVGADIITYTVRDNDGATSNEATISISVTPVNDPPTGIELDRTSVVENQLGAVVGGITVEDIDTNDTHSFVVSDDRFEVRDGEVRLKPGQQLNHEVEAAVQFEIIATDSGTPAESIAETFTISVIDANDPPVVDQPLPDASAAEDEVFSFEFADATFSDEDGESLTYTATLANGSPLTDWLTFDADNRRFSGTPLNDDVGTLAIIVEAQDASEAAATAEFAITIANTNDAPTDLSLDNLTVSENAAGAVIGNVTANDPDVGDSTTVIVDDERFEIVAGQLKLREGLALDHETTPSIDVTLTATDDGSPPLSHRQTFTVVVGNVNERPTSVELSASSILESSRAGTIVGVLSPIDPDASDTHVFTLADNGGGRFGIDGNELVVADATLLDFETMASHSVIVQVSDAGGLTFSASFTVSVTNVNEAPTAISLSNGEVKENTPGAVLGELSVADEDAGDTHTLTSDDDRFEVIAGVLQLKAGQSLHFDEHDPSIIVPVIAVDTGGLSHVEQIRLTVLAHPFPWRNTHDPLDSNNDGFVVALDALLIINYLNDDNPANLPVPPPATILHFLDTDGDNIVSPIDALLVINRLNSNDLQREGEFVPWIGPRSVTSILPPLFVRPNLLSFATSTLDRPAVIVERRPTPPAQSLPSVAGDYEELLDEVGSLWESTARTSLFAELSVDGLAVLDR